MNTKLLYLAFMAFLVTFDAESVPLKPKSGKGVWPFKINRFDKQGHHHGRWKLYLSDDKTVLRNGRFKHGEERGKWRYFYPSGAIRKIEYHKPNSKEFKIVLFHENGKKEKEGMARVVETERTINYYWYGTWEVYDKTGRFSHTEYYEKGNEISLILAPR